MRINRSTDIHLHDGDEFVKLLRTDAEPFAILGDTENAIYFHARCAPILWKILAHIDPKDVALEPDPIVDPFTAISK